MWRALECVPLYMARLHARSVSNAAMHQAVMLNAARVNLGDAELAGGEGKEGYFRWRLRIGGKPYQNFLEV